MDDARSEDAETRIERKLDRLRALVEATAPRCQVALEVADLDGLQRELAAARLTRQALAAAGEQRWEEGRDAGRSEGYASGYSDGYAAGLAAAEQGLDGTVPLPRRRPRLEAV